MSRDDARLFFAADPDAAARDRLLQCQKSLQKESWQREVRWLAPEYMHLTVKFLGATPRERIAEIVEHVRIRLMVPAMETEIDGISLFPNRKRPTVVAATLADDDSLSRLASRLGKMMLHFGYKPEKRKFRPHITIGRCGKGFPRGIDLSGQLDAPIVCLLDRLVLYESITRPEGAEYIEIARFHHNEEN